MRNLWEYADDEEFHNLKDMQMLPKMIGNWWEQSLRNYEQNLPDYFKKDLDLLFRKRRLIEFDSDESIDGRKMEKSRSFLFLKSRKGSHLVTQPD